MEDSVLNLQLVWRKWYTQSVGLLTGKGFEGSSPSTSELGYGFNSSNQKDELGSDPSFHVVRYTVYGRKHG